MPMFNLFSEVNILNASTIKKNRVGAYIIYHYSLQIFCIDFAFCQNTRNYKQSDFRKKKNIFSVSIRIALRKLEKYRF